MDVQEVGSYGVGVEKQYEDVGSFSFQVDTNSFSATDFHLFVKSLEQTYEKGSALVDQEYDEESDFDSLYEPLRFRKSGYEASSSGDTTSRTSSIESLVHPDVPYNSMVQEQSILQTRPSIMDIFHYFDEAVTIDLDDDEPIADETEEEPIRESFPQITPKKAPAVERSKKRPQVPAIKNPPPRELEKPKTTPGRLSENLLKIFESSAQPKNNQLPSSTDPPLPKAPIIRNKIDHRLNEFHKKVDNDSIAPPKTKTLQETPPERPPSTVKIVNATRKVANSTHGNNLANSLERPKDKCYVRDINDLFVRYRTAQLLQQPPQQQQQAQPILPLDEPMDEAPLKARKKSPEETAQQIHFRLQNQTYRLKMRTLIDAENFVQMTPANRNQLFHLDKIFNRSSLSLIHMVLSLIRENVLMGDRVSVDLQTSDYSRFIATMSEGSYGIDSMATSTIRENCVAVEILAVDDAPHQSPTSSRAVKIVILFVIETSDESAKSEHATVSQLRAAVAETAANRPLLQQQQRLDSDFQITVRMRFEVGEVNEAVIN